MRMNMLCGTYSKIALDNYYSSKYIIAKMEEKNDLSFCIENLHNASYPIIVCCVFSVMAIESFLNDYAATNLGDDEFYDNFDMLSLISKLQLISKFILNTEIDKSKAYYGNLKIAERTRNEYVHNKSRDLREWLEKKNLLTETYEELNEAYEFNELEETNGLISDLKAELNTAKTSILAMRDIAMFFAEYDSDCDATRLLFPQLWHSADPHRKKEIQNEFSIKL